MLLDLLLIGIVVAIEPIPLTAMILLLAAERGVIKGLGFVFGWLLTIVGIVALTVLVTDGKPLISGSQPSTAALSVKLLCGAILVFIGYRRRDRWRPASDAREPRKEPKWMAGIDRVNPLAAAGLGFLLQPWVLVAAGVSTITDGQTKTAAEFVALFAFCLLCTSSYIVMELYAVFRPAEVKAKLNALREWITAHRDQAIVLLSLGLGLYLIAVSIYGLVNAK